MICSFVCQNALDGMHCSDLATEITKFIIVTHQYALNYIYQANFVYKTFLSLNGIWNNKTFSSINGVWM